MTAPWFSIEDALQAQSDRTLYGTVFVTVDENGLTHRIDPTAIALPNGKPLYRKLADFVAEES